MSVDALDVNTFEVSGVALKLRIDFENDAILVALGINRRNLPLRERVVQRIVDILHSDPEAGCRSAVDDDVRLQPTLLPVGRDVDQPRNLAHALQYARDPGLQFVEIGIPQCELVLRPTLTSADVNVLYWKQECTHAGNRQRSAQPFDNLLSRYFTLAERLEADEHAPAVHGAAEQSTQCRTGASDGWIGQHDLGHALLQADHRLVGHVR